MDTENIQFLQNIADRANYYYKARKKAVKFIIDNKINNKELSVNIVLMAAVWAAHQLKQNITEEDLSIFFGLTSDNNSSPKNILKLAPVHEDLTLQELFELTVEQFR